MSGHRLYFSDMGATAGFQAEVLGDLTWALNDSPRLQYGEPPVGAESGREIVGWARLAGVKEEEWLNSGCVWR